MAKWSDADLRLRQWVLEHPGVCKEISMKCTVSAEYVRLVLYGKRGKSKNKRAKLATSVTMSKIKSMLRAKGAPIA
jgi:hypothetical protein